MEELEARFEESVSALRLAENSRSKPPLPLSANSLGLGGGVSARSLGLASGVRAGNSSSLARSESGLVGSSFPPQLLSSFGSNGSGMYDTLGREEYMSMAALGYTPSNGVLPSSSNSMLLGDLSLGQSDASDLTSLALHQNLMEFAVAESKIPAASTATATNDINLDSAALRDMARISNRGYETLSGLSADQRYFQEQLLAMQLVKGNNQTNFRGNTSLGLPLAMPNLSHHGSGQGFSALGSVDTSTALRSTGLARSASVPSAGLSQYASNTNFSRDLLQQQMLLQQMQNAEENAIQHRMNHLVSTMAAGAGGSAAPNPRSHGFSDRTDSDSKRQRFY